MASKLILPIERNEGGRRTVALNLPSVRPHGRRLRLELSHVDLLTLSLYVGSSATHAAWASSKIQDWRMNYSSDGDITLWCLAVGFSVSLAEGASIRAWLDPVGLPVTKYA